MTDFKTPGVYIQEISKFPASVAQVETAIPAFIGFTENAVSEVTRITSMVDFEDTFGGPFLKITTSISGTVGGGYTHTTPTLSASNYFLYQAMQMYFANGGGPCYIASSGQYGDTVNAAAFTTPLDLIKKEDEPTLIVMPEAVNLTGTPFYDVMKASLAQCNNLQDRFSIMDLADDADSVTDSGSFRSGIGTQYLKYGAAYYPRLNTSLVYLDDAVSVDTSGTDFPSPYDVSATLAELKTAADAEDSTLPTPISDALNDTLDIDGGINEFIAEQSIVLPPSSSIAGIYATVDRDRGVWKAPANVSLNNVVSPTIKISHDEQGDLNVTSTGKSINAIRFFQGKGNLVWGARTLAGNDNEWRYVPVRRLFIMIEESIEKAMESVVFEPNDANTWVRVRGTISNFLTTLWRQGALAGAKPEDAFFVNVGLGETMTAQDILEGKLIVDVAIAAVRPAEFIILRFSHKLQES